MPPSHSFAHSSCITDARLSAREEVRAYCLFNEGYPRRFQAHPLDLLRNIQTAAHHSQWSESACAAFDRNTPDLSRRTTSRAETQPTSPTNRTSRPKPPPSAAKHAQRAMENIIYEDSPLAAYLEGASACASTPSICVMSGEEDSQRPQLTLHVGEGTGEPDWVASVDDDDNKNEKSQATSFAPRGPSTLQSKLRKKLPRPLKLPQRGGSIHRIQNAYSVRPPHRSSPALRSLTALLSAPSTRALGAPTILVSSSTSASPSYPRSSSASSPAKHRSRYRRGLEMAQARS